MELGDQNSPAGYIYTLPPWLHLFRRYKALNANFRLWKRIQSVPSIIIFNVIAQALYYKPDRQAEKNEP